METTDWIKEKIKSAQIFGASYIFHLKGKQYCLAAFLAIFGVTKYKFNTALNTFDSQLFVKQGLTTLLSHNHILSYIHISVIWLLVSVTLCPTQAITHIFQSTLPRLKCILMLYNSLLKKKTEVSSHTEFLQNSGKKIERM